MEPIVIASEQEYRRAVEELHALLDEGERLISEAQRVWLQSNALMAAMAQWRERN